MVAVTGRTPAHRVTVGIAESLTPRMRRITLAGPSLLGLTPTPAQDIELILTDDSGRRVKRRYTIRRARPDVGEFDVDALLHDHGPGGRWATSVHPGEDVEFLGPRGKLELRPSDWNLFIADEAGLPAIAALIEASGVPSVAIVEVGDASDELDIAATTMIWRHRGEHPAGTPDLIATALASLADVHPPAGVGQAYLLGESRAVVALRPAVEALGISTERQFVKGYWNAGRGGRPTAS